MRVLVVEPFVGVGTVDCLMSSAHVRRQTIAHSLFVGTGQRGWLYPAKMVVTEAHRICITQIREPFRFHAVQLIVVQGQSCVTWIRGSAQLLHAADLGWDRATEQVVGKVKAFRKI